MAIRYPAPLTAGDRIGVTAPSAGVPEPLLPRLQFCVDSLSRRGFDVVVGACLHGGTHVSAPAAERAAELTSMLTDPTIRAVVPPWGGELAIDLLDRLDWDAIAAAEPTWVVGASDISTLTTPLTVLTGVATIHGPNLMDTPYSVPPPLLPWTEVASRPAGAVVVQGPSEHHRSGGFDDFEADPEVTAYTLDRPGAWRRLDSKSAVTVSGRLIGGCIETLSNLGGSRYGDIRAFVAAHAPEELVVYLEAAEAGAFDIGRRLHGMRMAGWFTHANAILIGRTAAPDAPTLTQDAAVMDALGGLAVPVIADVDCGHVPPHLALVNGAPTTVTWSPEGATLSQTLV